MLSVTKLGRYKIISMLGAGSMGKVYRARDTNLKRDVAIKVLPAAYSSNPEWLKRFEQEAQAVGSLNHPNILTVHDVGTHGGAPYIVSELLEGKTLREQLNGAALNSRRAIDFALQIAEGLSAAHERGIVHRDLKPENIFITKEGRVKILDFGLAKLLPARFSDDVQTDALTARPDTEAGVIAGTVAYMSPEQVRGETQRLDHRSDIFSFGGVLYEMLVGTRAFRGRSSVETMNAILNENPFDRMEACPALDAAITSLLRHCLEKEPGDRFQSTKDLVFALETLQGVFSSHVGTPRDKNASHKGRWLWAVLATIVVVISALAIFIVRNHAKSKPPPSYFQLTFRRGTVWSARFTPDEDTIVYSATFDGNPIDVFSTRKGSPESRSLALSGSSVLSVSSSGEMAILRPRKYLGHFTNRGTLLRLPLTGSAPRPLLNDVQEADWSPDGANLAIVRHSGERDRLEYPINNALYESEGWISDIRIAPGGDMVAFLNHPAEGDNRGQVAVVGPLGTKTNISGEWSTVGGLAWSPKGDEIWFTAKKAGEASALYAVTPSGKERVVLRVPADLRLNDISRNGRVLFSRSYERTDFFGLPPGETKERNLSWLDRGGIRDLSSDGKSFIFTYWGEGGGSNYTTYLRRTDGSPAVPLGEGAAFAISPDGNYVLAILSAPPQLVLLPTDVGESIRLDTYGIEQYGLGASWLPDGERVLFIGREKGQGMRCYVQSIRGGPPRAVTPEGRIGTSISPDGSSLIVKDDKQNSFIYPINGGMARPLYGLGGDERVIRWTDNARMIYIYNPEDNPTKIYRFDIQTGEKRFWREVVPSDRTGMLGPIRIFITPDGKSYVYAVGRYISDLYVVDGLK
jgi:serine/threonine protein kinase